MLFRLIRVSNRIPDKELKHFNTGIFIFIWIHPFLTLSYVIIFCAFVDFLSISNNLNVTFSTIINEIPLVLVHTFYVKREISDAIL